MWLLAAITEQQFQEAEFARLPQGGWRLLALLVLAALGYVVVWLYRRESRAGASLKLRMSLAGLRCAVLLVLALVWLEPVVATFRVRTVTSNVAVLVDVSGSMAVADVAAGAAGDGGQRRIDAVRGLLLERDADWLRRLASRNQLNVYAFGAGVERLTPPAAARNSSPAEPPAAAGPQPASRPAAERSLESALGAEGAASDLGVGLLRVLSDAGESPLAGVIVLSDGALNRGMSSEALAAYAQRFKAPLYLVGVGTADDPTNVRITSLAAPLTAPKGDPLEIRVAAAAYGIEPASLTLELFAERVGEAGSPGAGGGSGAATVTEAGPTLVATRTVELGGAQAQASETFRVDAAEAGDFVYTARIAGVPGEALERDNERTALVRVLDDKLRVLLVAGRPSYDVRYVTTLLERDQSIDVSVWLQSADPRAVRDGDRVISELPRQPEQLFEYDVLLLMDPEPSELDSGWAITVRRFVDQFNGGVLLQAGPHYASRLLQDERLSELLAILPVKPDPDADVRLSEQGAYRTQAVAMIVPDEAAEHPLLRMANDPGRSREVWAALPGVWWYLPVAREKPLASVLLKYQPAGRRTGVDTPVLLAVQPFGGGRTGFLASDDTWRWRATGQRYFERFWVQTVRYLAQGRRQGGSRRGQITLDRERIQVGDSVKIEARVLDARFLPWHADAVEAVIEAADGAPRSLALEAIPGREGWFAGRALFDWTGRGAIRVALPPDDAPPAPDAGRGEPETELATYVHVFEPTIELDVLRMQRETLEQLAEASGGAYVPFEEAGGLPDEIVNATRETKTRGADQPLWDRGWVMALVAGLLGVEWFLRRRNHLL